MRGKTQLHLLEGPVPFGARVSVVPERTSMAASVATDLGPPSFPHPGDRMNPGPMPVIGEGWHPLKPGPKNRAEGIGCPRKESHLT